MDKYKLQLGDTVALDIAPLLPASVTGTSRFIVMTKDLGRSKGLVKTQLLEVHAP